MTLIILDNIEILFYLKNDENISFFKKSLNPSVTANSKVILSILKDYQRWILPSLKIFPNSW